MRKVKLLALLLAALMVVAAFAGCANTEDIEKDVADLDDRVTALEGKIDANQKANEEQIKALTALVEALTKSQEEIKGSVEANKTAQDASNQAILDAINGLKNQIAEVEKEQADAEKEKADADKEAADKEAAEKEAAEKAEAEAKKNAEELAAAQKTASEAIALVEAEKTADRVNYFVDEYEAIVKLIAVAKNDVTAAKTAAEVVAVMETLNEKLAAYVAIDDQLYNYFTTLFGGITAANAELNETVQEYIKKAEAHYRDDVKVMTTGDLADVPALTEYAYGVDKDGTPLLVDLPAMLDVIDNVFTRTAANTQYTFDKDDYDALEDSVKVYSLAYYTKEATKLTQRIDDFVNNKLYKETFNYLVSTPSNYQTFIDLRYDFVDWTEGALFLSKDNVALIANTATMDHVMAVVENYTNAVDAIKNDYKVKNVVTGEKEDFLTAYNYYRITGTERVFYADYTDDGKVNKTYATKTIFEPIDAIFAAWVEEFKLSADDTRDALAYAFSASGFDYSVYLADKAYVALMDQKFADFENTIVPLVKALNKQDAIEVDAYEAFDALETALEAWVYNGTSATSDDVNPANYEVMVKRSGVIADYVDNAAAYAEALDLATFDDRYDAMLRAFFAGDYKDYKNNYATPINLAVKFFAHKLENGFMGEISLYTTKELLALKDEMVYLAAEGLYTDRDSTYLNKMITENNYAEGTNYSALALPTYYYGSDFADSATVPMSIRNFKDLCARQQYDGLAEVLVDEEALDNLLEKFNEKVEKLMANGGNAFLKEFNEIEYIALNAANAAGSKRAENVDSYVLPTDAAPANYYYVTLADAPALWDAYDEFEEWVKVGGNPNFAQVIDVEHEGYILQDWDYILGGNNYEIYLNIKAQVKKLEEEFDKLDSYFDILAGTTNHNYATEAILAGVVGSVEKTTSGNSTVTTTGYLTGYHTTPVTTTGNTVPAGAKTLKELIKIGFGKFVEFEDLNRDYYVKADGSLDYKSEGAVSGDADLWADINACVLAYVKQEATCYLNDKMDGTDLDEAIEDAVARIKTATSIFEVKNAIEFSMGVFAKHDLGEFNVTLKDNAGNAVGILGYANGVVFDYDFVAALD